MLWSFHGLVISCALHRGCLGAGHSVRRIVPFDRSVGGRVCHRVAVFLLNGTRTLPFAEVVHRRSPSGCRWRRVCPMAVMQAVFGRPRRTVPIVPHRQRYLLVLKLLRAVPRWWFHVDDITVHAVCAVCLPRRRRRSSSIHSGESGHKGFYSLVLDHEANIGVENWLLRNRRHRRAYSEQTSTDQSLPMAPKC